jgi:beta-barrel assembly-enhancing protease
VSLQKRIYITRKMVALLRNDGEFAGLLGHELGHILAHQNAIVASQLFRKILGVNVVSDRKDISDKLIRLFNNIDRDTELSRKTAQIIDRQEGIQNQADCVALYVSAAAGYSPQAYAELFDRSAGTNGSSSSILTDFFGTTTSSLRRLREIKKGLEAAPTTLPGNGSSRVARVPHMASRGHIGPRFRPMMGASRDEG